ncbi:unnamed protein product [Closterium sp. NIES-64]|nr:unnamed protein product [Closterium sp. NIES-64]
MVASLPQPQIPSYMWLNLAYHRRDLHRRRPSLLPPRLRPPRLRIPPPRAPRRLPPSPPPPPPPSRRHDTPSPPPPPAAAPAPAPPAHLAATPRRRLPFPLPRPPVTASPLPPPRLLWRRPRIPLPQRIIAACPSRCRDVTSPPPLTAAVPSSAPPAHPVAATLRRRLHAPSLRPAVAACASRRRDPLVAACTSHRRNFASLPAHPAAATCSSPPTRPATATYRRRLHLPPPRPTVTARASHHRDLLVAARTSRRRDLLVAARASRHRDLIVAAPASRRRDLLVIARASRCSYCPATRPQFPSPGLHRQPPAIFATAALPSPPALPAASPACPRLPTPPLCRFRPTLAANRSAVNWHSFVESIRRVLQDAFVRLYCVLNVLLRRPHALQPTAPTHPSEPPPPPILPGPPPPEPTLEIAATLELQAAADATFLHNRSEYLIRKAEHEVAVHHHEFATAECATRVALLTEYTTDMADYLPKSIAWAS